MVLMPYCGEQQGKTKSTFKEPSMEKKVITSPKTLVATSGYPKERLVFDKDREKDIA